MASRGARKAAQNKATKAAHAQARADRSAEWDRQRKEENITGMDIAKAAAGGIPFVGGALAAKDIGQAVASTAKAGAKKAAIAGAKALSSASVGSDVGAAGDYLSVADKAAKGLGKAAGIAGSVAGIVGAADAAYSAGKLANQMQRQNMTDEEYANFKRTGSTTGSRRGSRGRKPSPVKNVNPYGNNYAMFSDRLQQNLARQEDERAARAAEAHRAKQLEMEERRLAGQEEMRNQQILDMKIKQAQKFQVPADTGVKPINSYITTASRELADNAAAAMNYMKAGEKPVTDPTTGETTMVPYSQDDYVNEIAQIENQVPALQQFKEGFTKSVAEYEDALASGTLSAAMPPGTDAFYKSLRQGGGDYTLQTDPETGELTMQGQFEDQEGNFQPVSIPISGIGQMPKPMVKTQAPWEALKGSMTAMAVDGGKFNEEEAITQFDNAVAAGGKDALMSMAVDHYGMPYNEAMELYLKQDEDGNPALETALEQKWVETARTQYDGALIDIERKELDNAYKKAQIERMNRETQNAGRASATELKMIQQQNIIKGIDNVFANVSKLKNSPEEQKKLISDALVGSGYKLKSGKVKTEDTRSAYGKYAPNFLGGSSAPTKTVYTIVDAKGNPVGEATDDLSTLRQGVMGALLPTGVGVAAVHDNPY